MALSFQVATFDRLFTDPVPCAPPERRMPSPAGQQHLVGFMVSHKQRWPLSPHAGLCRRDTQTSRDGGNRGLRRSPLW